MFPANFLRTASRTALRRRRWPLCRTKTGKLFFFRQSSDPQQQQPKALEEEKPGLGLLAANQQQSKPNSLPLPQIRLQAKCIRSPFAPLPFDRPWGANRGGLGYAPVSRDEDLLPSCWFSFDSEDLERLHYKLQRRISRRRSLNRANCAFGDENPRRTQILEKYEKRLRGGMRRALSDQHIRFMDPKRDVEPEIQRQTSSKLAAQPPANFPGRAQKHKRVSFSSPSAAAGHQSAPTGGLNGGDLPALHRQLSRNKSSMSLQEPKLAIRQPAKPILARKSSADFAVGPFRHRSGTDASTGHSDSFAISPMDYATFRAWRRGSRLSIDVLNGAGAISPAELEKVGKSRPGLRLGLASLGQVLKRMLADCLHQSRAPDFACFQQQKTVN